jgi:hypothetical protein
MCLINVLYIVTVAFKSPFVTLFCSDWIEFSSSERSNSEFETSLDVDFFSDGEDPEVRKPLASYRNTIVIVSSRYYECA